VPSLSTWFHTIRYLRPVQIYGRLWFKLYHPATQLDPAPKVRPPSCVWVTPAKRRASLIRSLTFRFLNEEHELRDQYDWDNSNIEKLWRYNLHYFDDLNAEGAGSRADWHQEIFKRWVDENPPGQGSGWEPYPCSLRIVNWIKWSLSSHELTQQCLQSLAVQTRWLSHRLEYHLLGNHLFANAKALIFSGMFFEGAEAQRWIDKGLAILESELPEQILKDGGHFELSTMYHSIALEDLLDIYNLLLTYSNVNPDKFLSLNNKLVILIESMQCWLNIMCHPDGEIGLFNDAAIGIAPSLSELSRYALDLGFQSSAEPVDGITHLSASGYIRVQSNGMVSLLDVAKVGPDYLPGHAHADTFTFESSLHGQRLFVNSGTSKYGNDSERHRQRSTSAHNTICIDGQDSSEIWAGFRVARRACPDKPVINLTQDIIDITCSHNGYTRLPGKCIHQRQWQFTDTQCVIMDNITGSFISAVARFYIHPDIKVLELDKMKALFGLTLSSGHVVKVLIQGADNCHLSHTSWHPEFGLSLQNICIEAEFSTPDLTTSISW